MMGFSTRTHIHAHTQYSGVLDDRLVDASAGKRAVDAACPENAIFPENTQKILKNPKNHHRMREKVNKKLFQMVYQHQNIYHHHHLKLNWA